jgi:hypothetical protein
MVIYHHCMMLLSSCVIKHYNHGKYHRIAVNTVIKSFITLALGGKHKYRDNLLQYFNPRISRVKITMVVYRGIVL